MASDIEAPIAIDEKTLTVESKVDYDAAKQLRADYALVTSKVDPGSIGAEDYELIGATWTDDEGAEHAAYVMLRRDAPAEERERQMQTLLERCRTSIESNGVSTRKYVDAAPIEEPPIKTKS